MSQQHDNYPKIILAATDPDLPEDLPLGFDKYSDFREMTRGAGAMLESCWDRIMGRTVALKRLLPKLADDRIHRQRFLREARVTAQLQHPATVPVYEIGRDSNNAIYFTMKRIAGENLFKILQRLSWNDRTTKREYSLERLLEISVRACEALGYAHAHGVIHRDVKPENIWIGEYGEVTLLDWGVAKVWGVADQDHLLDSTDTSHEIVSDSNEPLRALTMVGQRPGTPLYMSPEQVLSKMGLDGRTDVFSMGVLLYEMVTFKEPFRGKNIHETFDNILHQHPIPPRQLVPDLNIPSNVQNVILKAVEKDPNKRYQKMEEMINDLRYAQHELNPKRK